MFYTQARLVLEMRSIKDAIQKKDKFTLDTLLKTYKESLKVPKDEIMHKKNITVCSYNVSYHLLSLYFLLDFIEFYYDGYYIYERQAEKNMFLINELSLKETGNSIEKEFLKDGIDKISEEVEEKIFVFLLPYKNKVNYTLNVAYPGHILILYANDLETTKKAFYEGIGEYYLNVKRKGYLPSWTNSQEKFLKEFVLWAEGKASKFR